MPSQEQIDSEATQSDLAARVAELEAWKDLMIRNILGPAQFRPGLLRFGRNIMELGNFGVQFKTDAATPLGSLYWPGDFQNTDPSAVYPRAEISGYATAGASYLQNLAYTNSTNYAEAYVFSGVATNPQAVLLSITPTYRAGISTVARESAGLANAELAGSIWADITALTQISANTNDYAVGAAYRSAISISSDAARDITGIDATNVNDGAFLFIQNTGSFAITLKDESASSTAANRFALTADVVLNGDDGCILQYNATSSRWRAIAAPAAAGSTGMPMPPLVGTDSWQALGQRLAVRAAGAPASATFPTANQAILYPFLVTEDCTVVKLWAHNGAAVSGNIDVGIYDGSFAKVVSIGSTAQAGISEVQEFNIADTALTAGTYYMAVAMDNTTGTLLRWSIDSRIMETFGATYMNTAFALPSTITPAAAGGTLSYLPLVGISTRTLVT